VIRRAMRALGFDGVRLGRYLLLAQLGGEPGEHAVGPNPLEVFLFEQRLAEVLAKLEVNCVLDVGANKGQYGLTLRRLGYTGHIVSFEPVPEVFRELEAAAGHDAGWTVHHLALGAHTARASIYVTRGNDFSSLLMPTAYAVTRFGRSAPVERVEEVEVCRLDEIFESVTRHVAHPRLFLKMDTQGYDLEVFAGAGAATDRMLGLQSEVAVVPLYHGMPTMLEALDAYQSAGFALSGLFPVSRDLDTARILEYDCLMLRCEGYSRTLRPAAQAGVMSFAPWPAGIL
jgi:FkbM family methyltransferase